MTTIEPLIPALDLSVTEIDFDEYTYIEEDEPDVDSKKCYFCKYKFQVGKEPLKTLLHKSKKIIKTCMLCHMILNFKGKYTEECLVYASKLTQLEIITKTIKYMEKNKKMPKIKDLDKEAVHAEISSFHFVQYLSSFNFVQYLSSLEEFKNYNEELKAMGRLNRERNKEYKIFFGHSKAIYNFFGIEGYKCLSLVDNSEECIKFHDDHMALEDLIVVRLYKEHYMKERKTRTKTILKYINMVYNLVPKTRSTTNKK